MPRQQQRAVKAGLFAVCALTILVVVLSLFRLAPAAHPESSTGRRQHEESVGVVVAAAKKPGAEAPPLLRPADKAGTIARGTLHVAGWHNCSNFRDAVAAARKRAGELRVLDLGTKVRYQQWVRLWLWPHVPPAKRAKHATSPSVWVSRGVSGGAAAGGGSSGGGRGGGGGGGGDGALVQWVGGKDALLRLLRASKEIAKEIPPSR